MKLQIINRKKSKNNHQYIKYNGNDYQTQVTRTLHKIK